MASNRVAYLIYTATRRYSINRFERAGAGPGRVSESFLVRLFTSCPSLKNIKKTKTMKIAQAASRRARRVYTYRQKNAVLAPENRH